MVFKLVQVIASLYSSRTSQGQKACLDSRRVSDILIYKSCLHHPGLNAAGSCCTCLIQLDVLVINFVISYKLLWCLGMNSMPFVGVCFESPHVRHCKAQHQSAQTCDMSGHSGLCLVA